MRKLIAPLTNWQPVLDARSGGLNSVWNQKNVEFPKDIFSKKTFDLRRTGFIGVLQRFRGNAKTWRLSLIPVAKLHTKITAEVHSRWHDDSRLRNLHKTHRIELSV